MDEIIVRDGTRLLKLSIAGIDRDSSTASCDCFRLTIYAFDEGPPVRPLFTLELDADQSSRLYSYLDRISLVREKGRSRTGRFVEIDETVPREVIEAFLNHRELLTDPQVVRSVLSLNPELARAVIENELDAIDVQSLAYRRKQLELMGRMLDDPDYFEHRRVELNVHGKEGVWQRFFEQNQWIFGFALHYVIGEGISPHRLEQVVAGHSIAGVGKRTDALLRTRGILRSLCYVEIKTHDTPLLHSSQYRQAVWRPSDELVGAVAQSQKTVQLAIEHLREKLELPLNGNVAPGVFFNYAPRSVAVCGSLSEFQTEAGVDGPRFSSFELYRRATHAPDIVTFDELHERAVAIVEAGFVASDHKTNGR